QYFQNASVQRAGRCEIDTERLFNNDTTKAAVFFLGETDTPDLLDNRTEQLARDGQVENCFPAGPFDDVVKPRIRIGLGQITREMRDAAPRQTPSLPVTQPRW